jgi:hypothetical protein
MKLSHFNEKHVRSSGEISDLIQPRGHPVQIEKLL